MRDKRKKQSGGTNKYRAIIIIFLLDVAFSIASYFLSRTILFFKIDMPTDFRRYEIPIAIGLVSINIAMLVFFDCYNTVWKYAGRVEFIKFILSYVASFLAFMLLKIILSAAFDIEVWSTLAIVFLLFGAILCGISRFFSGILHYLRHVRNIVNTKPGGNKRTLVIGAGYTGSLAVNRFINNPHEGYFPVGLVDDDPLKQGKKIYGIKVEGGIDSLDVLMPKLRVEAIVIAIMSINKSQLKNIYSKCALYNVPIKILPAMANAADINSSSLTLRDIKIEELLGREEFKVDKGLLDVSVVGKTVMVTGGAGSIGSELCRQALNFGCKHLIVFDVHENGMFELNEEFCNKYDTSRYSLVMGTVREKDKLDEVFAKYKPEIVFHAAAYKHVPMMEISPTEAIKNNVFGTFNVVTAAERAGVKKFVLISTDKAVNPANIMGASKRIAEMVVQSIGYQSSMQMGAVRFGNVLGSNGSVIPIFLRQIREGGPVTLTDRNIKRYFMTIPEAVRLVMQAGALATSGEIFVLDMGEPVFIYDLASDLIRISGLIPEKDISIKVTGLRPGEKLFEELRYDKEKVDVTQHEGIFVNKLEKVNDKSFKKDLEELKKYAFGENTEATVGKIFQMVPSAFRDEKAYHNIGINDKFKLDENNRMVSLSQSDQTGTDNTADIG